MSVSLFYMCVNVRTFPDFYWVGMCWLYNRRLPKPSGSLTSMIFPTPDHQGFWWFLFNPKTKKGTGKMKKSFFLITYALWAIVFFATSTKLYAVTSADMCRLAACSPNDFGVIDVAENCQYIAATCLTDDNGNLFGITRCTACNPGYTLVQTTLGVTCKNLLHNLPFFTCVQTCTSSNCKSDTSWSTLDTGYQQMVTRLCTDDTTCTEKYQYRCAAGYYGSSLDGVSGCTICPGDGTSVAGSTSKNNCYIPSGYQGSDSGGTYKYTSNCYWEN